MTPEKSKEFADDLVYALAKAKKPHRPIAWYLDVDGVLNAFSKDSIQEEDPWHYEKFNQTVDAVRYRITYAPDLMRVINLLTDEGFVEVHWLTTWQHEANGRLMSKLGLHGPFPVLTNPSKRDAYGEFDKTWQSELDGGWWKLKRIREQFEADPTLVALWTDDDLPYEREAQAFAARQGEQLLAVGPQPYFGLTPLDMRRIVEWVTKDRS